MGENELSKAVSVRAGQSSVGLEPVIDLLGKDLRVLISVIACGIASTEDMGEVQGAIAHRYFLGEALGSGGFEGSYRCLLYT